MSFGCEEAVAPRPSGGAVEATRPLALVTGASAGIGECFARELARRGHDLLLVARGLERLSILARELRAQHGAAVEVLAADLGRLEDLERVEERAAGAENLSLLVNNAGFGLGKDFLEADADAHEAMIRVHLIASVRLARAALPGMVGRRRGAVINLASVAGFLPRGGSVTYGATKGFLTFFTEALAVELRGTGVKVQALCPGLTHTEFHRRAQMDVSRKPGWLWMDAEEVVQSSLRCLERGRVVCVPGLKNRLFVALSRVVPRALLGAVVRRTDRKMQV
ncbi:MAG: SDR family oxidoreductase [Deltaproteobacteria bacterium]|nr:SDR family oxidoreductase [Deltaproteobacteria bacterium]